ncbi:MAG: S8 family serine peptidase [bacterium]
MKKIFVPMLSAIFLSFFALSVMAAKSPDYVAGEVILKLKSDLSIADNQAKTGIRSLDNLNSKYKVKSMEKIIKQSKKENNGLEKIYLLKLQKGVNIEEAIKEFNKDPNIEYAEPNYIVTTESTPDDSSYNLLWGMNNTGQTGGMADADIDAPEAWDMNTGNGSAVVAVIDTGIDYTHSDLAANIWINPGEIADNGLDDDGNGFIDDVHGWDFVNNDNDPMDDNGHGTHCAGTIGAIGNNGIGVVGVNWNVKVMPVKFLNASGSGSTDAAINAINYATLMGVNVMSNSWGGGGFSQALEDAIAVANVADISFIAAAGNSGSNNDLSPHYPSSYDVPNVIAVAATDHNDNLASFSCYGLNSVDLGAPGVNIYSTVPTGTCLLCDPSGYRYLNGTSMATPHVAGAAALLKSYFPEATVSDIKVRLLSLGDSVSSLYGKTVSGKRLNVYNSLVEADTLAPAAVNDLNVANPTMSSVVLNWTATGDDGNTGTAYGYDVRYSVYPIMESNWDYATQAIGEPVPQIAGSVETFIVTGLSENTTYYFALKVSDEFGNFSGLSNNASETTLTPVTLFFDDMESGSNGWIVSGINNLWELGTPTSGPMSAFSGVNLWGTNLSGNYGFDYTLEDLTYSSLDLTMVSSASLSFQNWYNTESSYDGGIVSVSIDGGLTWQYLNYGGYDHTLGCGNPIPDAWVAFSGSSNGWRKETIDLTSYVGNVIDIRFEFGSDCSVNTYPGWYIDDMEVKGTLTDIENQAPVAVAGPDQTANDVNGDNIENIVLDGTFSYDPDGNIISYEWKEGAVVLSTSPFFNYDFSVGTHTVVLTVTDNGNIADVDEVVVTVNPNQAPIAVAGPDQTAFVGETVLFNGAGSYDPDGTIVSYNWDFGDSSAGSGTNPSHIYTAPGIYNVTLTVTDNGGASNLNQMTVTVQEVANIGATITGHSVSTRWDKKKAIGKVQTYISFNIGSGSSDKVILKEITDEVGSWSLESSNVLVKINGKRYNWTTSLDINGDAIIDFGAHNVTLKTGDNVQISAIKLLNNAKANHSLICRISVNGNEIAVNTVNFSF